nr:hypothetical protein [Cryobacterium algoricola]
MTLLELIVSMGIFLLFVALVLGTTVTIAKSASRSQLVAESSNTAVTVFGMFDRQTRYADAINFPGAGSGGKRYVEFRTPADSAASGVTTCVQWRFDPVAGTLASRTWSDLTGTPGTFVIKASNVIDDGTGYPFALTAAVSSTAAVGTGMRMQQLSVAIHIGNAGLDAGALMKTSFSARNSSDASPSNAQTAHAGVSDTPVCTAGVRS